MEIKLVRKIINGNFIFEIYKNNKLYPKEKWNDLSCQMTKATACNYDGIFTVNNIVSFTYKNISNILTFSSKLDFFNDNISTLISKLQARILIVNNWVSTLSDFTDEGTFTIIP